jgi:hypothetical protein
MPNPTDPAAGLREALAAVADALGIPWLDGMTAQQRQAWLEVRLGRAAIAAMTTEWTLDPGARFADHVRYTREQIAARGQL